MFLAIVLVGTQHFYAGSIAGTVSYSGTQSGALIVRTLQTDPMNKVLKLDGNGDYAEIDSLNSLGGSEITVQFWFRGTSAQSAVRQQGPGWVVSLWNGMHILSNDGGTSGIAAGAAVTDGQWHHILFTWKQNTRNGFASYLDGRPVASRDSSNTRIAVQNAPLFFGALLGGSEFTAGKLDEIAIWNRALGAEEVARTWNRRLEGTEEGLIGLWDFESGRVEDNGPFGYDGILHGDAVIVSEGIPGLGAGYETTEGNSAGAYLLENLPDGQGYTLSAFIDLNGNRQPDPGEPSGQFAGSPFTLAGSMKGVDILLTEPPRILRQPVESRLPAGAGLDISVLADGTGPLTYTWTKDAVPVQEDGRVFGANASVLHLSNANPGDSGFYRVRIANTSGVILSDLVRVQILTNAVTAAGQVTYVGRQTGPIQVKALDQAPGNQVLSVDGNSSVETSLSSLSGSELTIEYWFKGSSFHSAVRQQSDLANYIVAGWNGRHILSNDGGTDGGISAGQGITDGQWHHLAVTWMRKAKGGFASYLDGNLVESRDAGGTAIPALNSHVFFGAWNGTAEFGNGQLDEIAIWKRALSAAEIAVRAGRPLQGNEPGLVGYWTFDGTLADQSPFKRGGRPLGNALLVEDRIPNLGYSYTVGAMVDLSFSLTNLPAGGRYLVSAFMDVNGNAQWDTGEPMGKFAENPASFPVSRSDVVIELSEPPRIAAQPAQIRAEPGTRAQLAVTVAGTRPLSFQWSFNGLALTNSARVSGADSPELSIANVSDFDAGLYTLRASNILGYVVSKDVRLSTATGGYTVSGTVSYSGPLPGGIGVVLEQFKPGNKALRLGGFGDLVRIPKLKDLSGDELSLQFWFKGSHFDSVVSQSNPDGTAYITAGRQGGYALSNDGGAMGLAAGTLVTNGFWHHLTMTWKKGATGGFVSYLDGTLVAQRDSSASALPQIDWPVYFGSDPRLQSFAEGEVDEIAIWSRSLTASEVNGNWNKALAGAEPGLLGFWNFDNGSARDLSGHGFDGELAGGATIVDARIEGFAAGRLLDELSQAGAFVLNNVPAGEDYFLSVFLDTDGDGLISPGESVFPYDGNPLSIKDEMSGLQIDLDTLLASPVLSIRVENAVELSWPASRTGYLLETSASLASFSWMPVAGVINNRIILDPGAGSAFFRLRKQ